MDDLISRQAVDDAIYDYSRSCDVDYAQIMEYIDNLPTVNPQADKEEYYEYCKHDGKKMYHLPFIIWLKQVKKIKEESEPQESEDKE